MSEVAVAEGDWVLFRTDGSYDRVGVEMKRAEKVTPKLVKFSGGWPRQVSTSGVVAAFSDEKTAKNVRDAIGGVAGEFARRKRKAETDHAARMATVNAAAEKQIAAIIARASTSLDRTDV